MKRVLVAITLALLSYASQAAITYDNTDTEGFDSLGANSTANDLAIPKPADSVTGALSLILGVIDGAYDSTFALNNVTGEVVVDSVADGTSVLTAAILRRAADNADPITYDFDHSTNPNEAKSAIAIALTGHDSTAPIRSFASATGSSTTPQAPDTPAAAQNGDMVIRVVCWEDNGSAITPGHPAGHTLIANAAGTAAGTNGVGASYVISSGGQPGTADFTLSLSRPWVAYTIVVAVDGGGGGASGLLLRRRRN